ncbi:L-alanine-DL-glutamate epimerase [Caenispirillum salinarum AK4]|uniref:Dipeptide epimerase n=1 Tax=Caenispirillum salinarum AK4 TaxID=1238182 RepID=K9GY40_9PROT|nr:N-acetyl-D-Glu racemase DgcA [Caenispirillum salinarum]EKV30152.1 L-alanine-DL-glutamate epimerase [Caenispirillum salinarum AK4]
MTTLTVLKETWPIAGSFTISRGSKTAAEVVVAQVERGGVIGRGECVPYARYGESVDGVAAALEALRDDLARPGFDRAALRAQVPAGAARNALDCALWDLEAKESGVPAWKTAGVPEPAPVVTAQTVSLGTPDEMRASAAKLADRPLLKLKVGAEQVVERVRAVREAAPNAAMIVDANEAWTPAMLAETSAAMAELKVDLIEQPLPAGADEALEGFDSPVPLCADESAHTAEGLEALAARYQLVNIKLDKTGGLTEALEMARKAQSLGLVIMVGCMVGTSLAMAPAVVLAGMARFVDLDGPLILAQDRDGGITFDKGILHPPMGRLWG